MKDKELNAPEQFAKLQGQVDVVNNKLENVAKSIDILGKELKEAIYSPEGINKRLSVTYDIVLALKNDRETDHTKITKAEDLLSLQDKRIEVLEELFLKLKTIIGVMTAVIGFLGIPLIIQIFQFIGGVLGQN